MSGECDTCGLSDPECHCYLHELERRVEFLEDGLDQLTEIVKNISEYLKSHDDEFYKICKNELVACVCMNEKENFENRSVMGP